jgi:hypothetical protein
LVIVPLGFTLSIQLVSGVPHPSHFAERGLDHGFTALVSRVLFSPGELVNNLLHVPVFAALALLWCWALPAWCRKPRLVAQLAAGASLSFAILNEWSQVYVPRRFSSPGDVVANSVGVGLGLLLWFLARRLGTGHPTRDHDRAPGSTGD